MTSPEVVFDEVSNDGWNRITTWDTHAFNLADTTTCLNEVLLSPLRNSACRKSLVFIDACANTLGETGMLGRSVVVGMQREEFAEFVKSTDYAAAFFSCSPTQKSYPSQAVGHGIWTHHLLRAFRGQEATAFARDRSITGESIQDRFLSLRWQRRHWHASILRRHNVGHGWKIQNAPLAASPDDTTAKQQPQSPNRQASLIRSTSRSGGSAASVSG